MKLRVFSLVILASQALPALASAAPDLDQVPAAAELGTVCYDDGTSRRLLPEDAVQLAKMIDGETWGSPSVADAHAMSWAIAARSGIWGFPKWTLADLIRAYSQPINPKWTRTGSACKQYYAAGYTGDIPDSCSVKRVDRRERNIAMSWADTALIARREVLAFAAGTTVNPVPGMVGWFAPGMWRKREGNGANLRDHMIEGATIADNVYVKLSNNPDTTAWTDSHVRVVGPGQSCATTTKPAPAGPSCATDYTYHRDGEIFFVPPFGTTVTTLVIANAGTKHKVCGDSTGMIYVGASSDAFVTDADGQQIRFKVTKLEENAVTVEITQGKLTRALLDGNKRVVLRRRK